MGRQSTFNATAAIRSPWASRFGNAVRNTANAIGSPFGWSYDNGYEMRFRNAAGTDDIRALSVDGSNRILIAEALAPVERKTITFSIETPATQAFFIADQAYRVTSITWSHKTQSTVAGTAYVEKLTGTTAPGSGSSLQTGTFDCTATNVTPLAGTLYSTGTGDSDDPRLQLAAGNRLGLVMAGTFTTLAGVQVTVTLSPGGVARTANYVMNLNADMTRYQTFFVANRPYVVTGIQAVFSTKSSVSGLKLTVTKDTSTTSAGGGTSLLSDNTSAGVLMTGTANTVLTGTLAAAAATLRLAAGDRLAICFNGASLTALVGLVVTVTMQEMASSRKEISFALDHTVGQADLTSAASTAFFTADRDYEILDLREIHDVVGNDGGTVTVDCTIDTGTTAPGGGTSIMTGALSLKAPARTTQVGTLAALGARYLLTGDRLSAKFSGTTSAAKGLAISVAVKPS